MKTEMLPTDIPMTTAGEPFARVTTLAGETYFVDGFEIRKTFTGYGTEVHVRRCGGLGWTRAIAPIAAVELLTPAEYLALFEVGSKVFVPKYGDTYAGRVEEIGRTRLVVRFLTRGGKSKSIAFPLRDVGLVLR
jgi:hypothetical protein